MTNTVQNHINDVIKKGPNAGQLSRPYIDSDGTTLLLKEIMESGNLVQDEFVETDLRWDVKGTFRDSDGIWELVVDINLLIAYLNIGIDSEDMGVKCIWGLSPKKNWCEKTLSIPYAEGGRLILLGEYEPGMSWRIDGGNMWKSYCDKETGWYCIGNPNVERYDLSVRINKNTIVLLNELNELKSIFIQLTCR